MEGLAEAVTNQGKKGKAKVLVSALKEFILLLLYSPHK